MTNRLEGSPARRAASLLRRSLLAMTLLGSLAIGPLAAAQAGARFANAPDGLPLCVFEAGNPLGPPILLIHGFSQSHWVFKLQLQSPLARDFRLLAYDLRGHGCSGKPWQASDYRSRRIANDVAAVIREFRLTRPLLVGWSYGGFVIMDFIRHHGDSSIAGAMLVGSNAGLAPPPKDAAAQERARQARESSRNASPDIDAGIRRGHEFVSLMTARPAPADMAEIMFATNQMLPAYARRAMADLQLQNDDLPPRIHTPLLLLAGDKDGSQSRAVLEGIAGRLADAQVVMVPGAGHAPFIDAPEEFERELRAFAARTRPR